MLRKFSDISLENLVAIGFTNPTLAATTLRDLAGHGIADDLFERLLPNLEQGLLGTGDPDRALANFERWLAKVGNRSAYVALLSDHPAALNSLLAIFSASQFLSDLLAKYPEHFEVVINPSIRDIPKTADDYYRDAALRIRPARTLNMRRDALRRFKPPEILRIGARDILGKAGTEEITREISDFAESCVRSAVDIANANSGFAVIAMGKLGGQELNYASDIDLIYVHDDSLPQERALEIADNITTTLSKMTDAGLLFRVDLRLRPEGRFGPVSRSLASCRAYYESWAEAWERQALIKARVVGGDRTVGEGFMAIAESFAYRKTVDIAFVESIRENKRLIERKAIRDGVAESDVKEGFGGIRDFEFLVQLIQLVSGGARPEIRTGSTMEALRRLETAGILTTVEASELAESYLFLRNVEHRLQIMDERPVRNIPVANTETLFKFARRLKYLTAEDFLCDYRHHTSRNNAYLQRIFYGSDAVPQQSVDPVIDWLNDLDNVASRDSLSSYMSDLGFLEPAQALRVLERNLVASGYGDIQPAHRQNLIALAPRLLNAFATTGSPDVALRGFDQLASNSPSPAAFLGSLADSPDLVEHLAVIAADASGSLWQTSIQHPELLDMLADSDSFEHAQTLGSVDTAQAVAAFLRRERLRIGALDLWGLSKPESTMIALSNMAAQALQAALECSSRRENYEGLAPALIGLGKLGGQELSYGSDWDVLWIAPVNSDLVRIRRVVEGAMAFLNTDVKMLGEPIEVDPRLRPDGRHGALVRTISDYKSYFDKNGEIWERQVLLKARVIGGDLRLGEEFMDAANSIVYNHFPDDLGLAEIRHLKSRMENERAKSKIDIKLGYGGLSDIEWTVQLMQWRYGKRWLKAQTPNTLAALLALRDSAVLRQDDWEILSSTYVELYRLRNRLWLRQGRAVDSAMDQPASLDEKRKATRVIFERLFLGNTPT